MKRRGAVPAKMPEPIDPALRAIAIKIVERATVGRRWYFHNDRCIAFFCTPENTP